MKKKIIVCNKNFDKKKIKYLIEWFICNHGSIKTSKLLNKLKDIGLKFSTKAGISIGPNDLLIPEVKNNLIKNMEEITMKYKCKLFEGNITQIQFSQKIIEIWNITNESLKDEIVRNFQQKNILNPLYMMIFSGARGNISQIKQLVGIRGLMSDSKGEIINSPIKNNLKEGLNFNDYFISCYGARKGIIDTALKTASSGYLTRRLIYASQNVFIKQPDCYTKMGNLIKLLKKTKKNYLNTKEKIIGRILGEDIMEMKTKRIILSKNQDICNYAIKRILKNKNYIFIRTPLNCVLNNGICQLCYGWNLTNNKIVKLGESIGILAAQSIGEPGTQLTMRTFHTGGIFTANTKKVIQSPISGLLKYSRKDVRKIITIYGEKAFFLSKEKILFLKEKRINLFKIKIPKFSILFLKTNERVFRKQVIAEISKWGRFKTNNSPKKGNQVQHIKTNNSGEIYLLERKFQRIWILNGFIIKENKKKELINSHTKVINNILVLDEKHFSKRKIVNKNIKNNIIIINIKTNIRIKFLSLLNKNLKHNLYEIKRIRNSDILINKSKNKKVIKFNKKSLGKFIQQKKRKKIFFGGQITEIRRKLSILKKGISFLLPKKSKLKVKNNSIIDKNNTIFDLIFKKEKTKDIVAGLPKIEKILEVKKETVSYIEISVEQKIKKYFNIYRKKYNNSIANRKTITKIQNYLIKQIKEVYKSQNVNLSEKHIEIIIKQMTSKVILKNKGQSNLMSGEIININRIEKINQALNKKAIYEPIILGISQIPKLSDSFISAICFQETTRILTRSALMGRVDWLKGLKENLIIGNLIPTGTGYKII